MDDGMMRQEAELDFQARRAKKLTGVAATPEHIFERYRRTPQWRFEPKEFVFRILNALPKGRILDFGCGEGEITTQLARLGWQVTGVDVSPELIEVAEERAKLDGVLHQVELAACDITEKRLPPNRFDAALCYAVLHHVDIRKTVPAILASLKPGATAIFVEPIAFSPRLQKLRDAVPVSKHVSPGEKQLDRSDVDFIAGLLASPRTTFFYCLGRVVRFFPTLPQGRAPQVLRKVLLLLLAAIDRAFISACPPVRRYCGQIIIVGQKPGVAGS